MLALAVATKPSAVLALVPSRPTPALGALGRAGAACRARRARRASSRGVLLLAYREVLGELWQSVVVYHRDARDTPDVIDKTHELATFLDWRTPFAWLIVAGLAASVLLLRRRRLGVVWALWAWAAISLAFLVYHHPLHYNHLLVLPVVLAVPVAIALVGLAERLRRPAVAFAALALLLSAGYVQQQRRIVLDQVQEEPELVAAAGSSSARPSPTSWWSRTNRSSPSSPTGAWRDPSSTPRRCASRPGR